MLLNFYIIIIMLLIQESTTTKSTHNIILYVLSITSIQLNLSLAATKKETTIGFSMPIIA